MSLASVRLLIGGAPLWAGEPHNVTDYASNPRPVLFRDMEPNPTDRIVRAACRTVAG